MYHVPNNFEAKLAKYLGKVFIQGPDGKFREATPEEICEAAGLIQLGRQIEQETRVHEGWSK